MNPFEHQHHAAKFNPDNFAPKKIETDLPCDNAERTAETIPSQSIRKLKPSEMEKFDLETILRRNRSFRSREDLTAKKETASEETERAKIKTFFQTGNFEEITNLLANKGVESLAFHKEVLRIKNDYKENLSSADFLTHEDWRILTAIELFDKKTFEHCVGTYIVARKKIEERLVELGQEIIQEGVDLAQFYRGCLFHDIGKMAIPEFILNNTTTDAEWVFHFMELSEDEQDKILVENKIIVPDAIRNDFEKMADFFTDNRIRAVKFIPIKAVLSKEQLELFIKLGLSQDDSLGEIMRIHEKKSEEILLELGYVIESLLAGNHHNYKHRDKKLGEKPTSLSAVHISGEISSNIIHLADVQQALNGDRSYHHKQPMLRIMAFLIDDAENEIIDPIIAARWIDDELRKINPAYLDEIRNMKAKHQHHDYLQKRHTEIQIIDDFLNDNLPEKNKTKDIAA